MFCKNCGKEIPDNSEFCKYCGSSKDGIINEKSIKSQSISSIKKIGIFKLVIPIIAVVVVLFIFLGRGTKLTEENVKEYLNTRLEYTHTSSRVENITLTVSSINNKSKYKNAKIKVGVYSGALGWDNVIIDLNLNEDGYAQAVRNVSWNYDKKEPPHSVIREISGRVK